MTLFTRRMSDRSRSTPLGYRCGARRLLCNIDLPGSLRTNEKYT